MDKALLVELAQSVEADKAIRRELGRMRRELASYFEGRDEVRLTLILKVILFFFLVADPIQLDGVREPCEEAL